MGLELRLVFPDPHHVTVQSPTGTTQPLPFANPLTAEDLQAIRWYLETYSAQYTAEEDDRQAQAIEAQLPQWGTVLFEAALGNFAAQAAFMNFYNQRQQERRLIIGASHPEILALPWELLHVPQGSYVFNSNPRITVQRQFNSTGGFNVPPGPPRERVRILFIVSRPRGAGFIDPRSDAQAVLAALEQAGQGRFEVEFLRPATVEALRDRLDDTRLPPIDVIHFDGHGVYDATGALFEEARRHQGLSPTRQSPQDAAEMGYLLFEDDRGDRAIVSAEKLAALLNEQTVGLVVLSACQSAMVGSPRPADATDEAADPTAGVMGSVAARLTHGGIPAVLAMTHSVLVTTTEALFGQFYQNLGRGQGMGEALDNARRHLFFNTDRGTRLRGQQQEVTLRLQDWFLPALYQAGGDVPLLVGGGEGEGGEDGEGGGENLPEVQEAGFWGRSWELWQIERAFVGGTRRLSITGFGGQGKTYLAVEAGRWLYQTGMFERVSFVDYAAYQGLDPVSYAVSTLATVLGHSLLDAAVATAHLGQTPTLVILDNLEALEPEPQRRLLEAAKAWSEAGQSRVLLTTRQPSFAHPAYPTEGSRQHLALPLRGLGSTAYPNDALAYFRALWALPPAATTPTPERAALVKLFALVDFHPLSIGLLARQLKTRRIAEVGTRLAELLQSSPVQAGEPPNPLVASLLLSLDRLDDQARQWLPRLGVFQGGAMEPDLLAITEITEAEWQPIRAQLEHTGLIRAEYLPNIDPPYLKFHPTLAPVLWAQVPAAAEAELQTRHRQRYYQLSGWLYHEDVKKPHEARAIARRELPNLMAAVNWAIAAGDGDAVAFGEYVNKFLNNFGLSKDREDLATLLQSLQGEVGSQAWYLARSNQGEVLLATGRVAEALEVFADVLQGLGNMRSYDRCTTLGRMGRCLEAQGQAAQAAACFRVGIAEAAQLEQNNDAKQLRGLLQTDLGNVLTVLGDYGEAQAAYEASLMIAQELSDAVKESAVQSSIGMLALEQGDLATAETRYQAALATFQRLEEPAGEAVAWHQLGRVYEEAQQWEAAERHYREAARLKEAQEMIGGSNGAVKTWNQLAIVNQLSGRLEMAIAWYEKAIAGGKATEDWLTVSRTLSNLAALLQSQPHPSHADLATARHHAEAALAIKQTLDPAAAEIWKTYTILAEIADQQDQADQAQAYRQQARHARAAFAGTQQELRQLGPLILLAVSALTNQEARRQLDELLSALEDQIPGLSNAICRILSGDRNEATLVDPLSLSGSMIVSAILRGIADPTTLQALLGDE
ncbi:CHAT domain-containing protein [Leptolyngbya sp. KIOST-1]|uniref:CHAT domain-containing protein n=1 Tax=Leptolyngbya sp. KIOST-1 TaxID=1229172 RepID=UPI000560BF34|nr:CHAT domain-containing protein [Leptolyngbya sp. KIOST-1]